MSPMRTVQHGDATFRRRLRSIDKKLSNPDTLWPKVGSYLSRTANRQFVTEGQHLLGRRWTALKPSYRLWKIRQGYSRKILVQGGDMRKGLTKRPMDIEEYHGNSAVFGSSNPKVTWHHGGTKRNGKRVNPPRPILVFNQQVRDDIRQIMVQYAVGKRRKRP